MLAKLNAVIALRDAVGARGLACRAFPDGMAVRVERPDGLRARRAGPVRTAAARRCDRGADPVIVVEVVSPSSRGIDRGRQARGYFSLPSVRHYLIVDTDKQVVIHHRRDEEGRSASGSSATGR